MLDSMRRNANSWVFSLLFAIIIFVFAVNFGPWAGRHDAMATYAALVNGHEIGVSQLNAELNRYARSGISLEQMRSLKMDRRILESLVENELLAQFAEKNGLVVTDEQLVEAINRLLGGKSVSNEDYRKLINSELGMKVEDFEIAQRRRMLAFMVTDALVSNIPISESDLKTNFFIRNEKVKISYVVVDPAQTKEAQKAAGEIIENFNSGNKKALTAFLSEFFSRDSTVLPRAVVDAGFKLSEPGRFLESPIAADGKLYVIGLKERQAPKESDFLKAKDTLRQTLENERKNALRAGFVDDLKKTANIEYNESLFQAPSREGPIEG